MQLKNPLQWQERIPLLTFLLSFSFFVVISWCAPYSSDDLEFATLPFTSFPQYLQYVLGYGNGRLLGNLCSIWLSNSRLMCILVKSAVLASVVVLMPLVLDLKEKQYYLASFLLVATVDPAIFGEVYAWTSGFSNYVPSVHIAGLSEEEKKAVPEIRAPYDTDVYCVTCNKTVHVKAGEVVPFCCGRLMEILD